LLDNYYLVDEQFRKIRDDLPPSYYRQLPKLSVGEHTPETVAVLVAE
jgi:cyclic beta-1,2-glucan synthetase